MNELLRQFKLKPKTLFLIDGLGAFITASILFVFSRIFYKYIGIPPITLTYLSLIAAIFCLFSLACFFWVDNFQPFLTTISAANLLYCCLTIGLVYWYYESISKLGISYFLAEIIVICAIVFIEIKTINHPY